MIRALVLLYVLTVSVTQAEDIGDDEWAEGQTNNNEDGLAWLDAFSGIGPYLIFIFFVVFSFHIMLYPNFAMQSLMRYYLDFGHSVIGEALSCETKAGSGGDKFIVEVMYIASEHRFADNPSQKFRNPHAFEKKKLMRRFEYSREILRGEPQEVLLILTAAGGSRSGCPREVVENILAVSSYSRQHSLLILFPSFIIIATLLGLAIREVLLMDEPSEGWIALLAGLGVIEAVSFFYVADRFAKAKRRRFDSARPMLTSIEREAAAAAAAAKKPVRYREDPFKMHLHDFSGHARATDRNAGLI